MDQKLSELPVEEILLKRRSLRRKLSARNDFRAIRIAVLGGSTTKEVVDLLDLWLLNDGFSATFYQSEYGRYYVEAVHDSDALAEFKPDIVYVHTSCLDLQMFPPAHASEAEFQQCVDAELRRYQEMWGALRSRLGCQIIQNNFEFPPYAILGNLDAVSRGGHTRFVTELNVAFATAAATNPNLLIQDVCSLSARGGLDRWFDWTRYYSYKIVTTPAGSQALAMSLAAMVRALYGRARKVLVLDLDNTLWGGVIGDDGVDKIQIGRETPVAEAFTAFQKYCLSLRDSGVLLAVCSKNDEETAREGFRHPDSVLKLEDFSCFKANWKPKHENIRAIAEELRVGADSFVFIDDNPAERAIVEGQVEGIAVPDVGPDVADYPRLIEAQRYFEPASLSLEDTQRASLYRGNAQRAVFEQKFADYGAYLDSLEMTAEIERFQPLYIDRIAQLTNKTNQFNLTTKRYTRAQMESVLGNPAFLGLYGKLSDRFGDNGLISVVLARRDGKVAHIDLWLMSCRVLKRDVEAAMLDAMVKHAQAAGVAELRGTYIPTKKNGMVAEHYSKLGFEARATLEDGTRTYSLDLREYAARNTRIRVKGFRQLVEGTA